MSIQSLAPLNPTATPALSLRRACAADAAALSAFLQRLSVRSRRLRFHGACAAASPSLAQKLCAVDGVRHQAWLAWAGDGDAAVLVGEARFVVSACGQSAELAIAVADAWQGQGVAPALMQQLLAAAAAAGVFNLYGDVLDQNPRMQAFMRRHGFEADLFARGDVLRMTRDLRVVVLPQQGGGLLAWLGVALRGAPWLQAWRNLTTSGAAS